MRKAVLDFRISRAVHAETRRRARRLRWAHAEIGRAEAQIERIERHGWGWGNPDRVIERMAHALRRRDRAMMVLEELENGFTRQPRPLSHWREIATDLLLSV